MKNYLLISDDYGGYIDYTRHACRGIVVKDDKILLCHEVSRGIYIIPGGGLEENETHAECVIREILEETGCLVEPKEEFLHIEELYCFDINHLNHQHFNHYFRCEYLSDTYETHQTKDEQVFGCTAEWLTISEALEIFGSYENYRLSNKAVYGLYKRELLAIKAYLLGDMINLTCDYQIKRIEESDLDIVLEVMNSNPEYYHYCPPSPGKEHFIDELTALPPNMTLKDKYYLGLYNDSDLVCIVDIILGYPTAKTAYIGFFMINKNYQRKHLGSKIVADITTYFKARDYDELRLGYVLGNNKAKAFWESSGFVPTGVISHKNVLFDVVVMNKKLK